MSTSDVFALFAVLMSGLSGVGAILWSGYERQKAGRANDGTYIESLAAASHDLVDMYREQVITLELRVSNLTLRFDRVEQEVRNCEYEHCPLREHYLRWSKRGSDSQPILP